MARRTTICWIACLCLALLDGARVLRANTIVGTRDWQIVSRLTGPTLTGQVGVGGTDLGHMVNHNGKVYYLFGDTFASDLPGGANWRQNVMAYSTDLDPHDGISLDGWITRSNGTARQVIVPGTQATTYIPTGGISVGDKIYAWYMHVSDWSTGWTLSHAGLAKWREGDSQFTTVPGFKFQAPAGDIYSTANGAQGPGNFGMVAASYRSPLENVNDDYIYLWGTPGGREGGVKLARVLPNNIENLGSYQFFDGQIGNVPQWTNNEFAGEKIIDSGVGEMSVMYNSELRKWTMMSISGGAAPDFQIRYADEPWGTWSNPITVTRFDQAPGLYAPYMNPLFVEDNGKTLYFTMSLWDPYDVYLAKVTLDIDYRTQWTGASSNWSDGAGWSDGVPNEKYQTTLDNGGRIVVDAAAASRGFEIGTAAGATGRIELVGSADLTIHDGPIRLGAKLGSSGALVMRGGALNVLGSTGALVIADQGTANATFESGSVNAGTISVATDCSAIGQMYLRGDAAIAVSRGSFQMARLRNSATGAQSHASLEISGGTIAVNPVGSLATARNFVVGWDGVATMTMSGGTVDVTSYFVSAVSAGDGLAPASSAVIVQTGGTIRADGMTLAEAGNSSYTLAGTGKIRVGGQLRLGWLAGATSNFIQNGGAVELASDSQLSNFSGLIIGGAGNANYAMNGGTLSVAGNVLVAELNSSHAEMAIYDGSVAINGLLRIGPTGMVTLDGGVLTAAEIANNSGGVFHFDGGTLAIGQFTGNLTNEGGRLAAGIAQSTIVVGNYFQHTAARLAIEIEGASSNSQYGDVNVAGTATLGGQLQLDVHDDFIPAESDSFAILTSGGALAGAFANVSSGGRLMTSDGSGSFAVFYGSESPFQSNQVVLTAFNAVDLPGDFNRDGTVDAADYAVWRDNLGATLSLPNETETLGVVTVEDYYVWKQQFGASGGSASSAIRAPEPNSLLLVVGIVVAALVARRRAT